MCLDSDYSEYYSDYSEYSAVKETSCFIGYINPFSAGIDFRRQILTSKVDPRAERIKYF